MISVIDVLNAAQDYEDWMRIYACESEADGEGGVAEGSHEAEGAPRDVVMRALKKLRENLGHDRVPDMLRVLVHGGASPLVLKPWGSFD